MQEIWLKSLEPSSGNFPLLMHNWCITDSSPKHLHKVPQKKFWHCGKTPSMMSPNTFIYCTIPATFMFVKLTDNPLAWNSQFSRTTSWICNQYTWFSSCATVSNSPQRLTHWHCLMPVCWWLNIVICVDSVGCYWAL